MGCNTVLSKNRELFELQGFCCYLCSRSMSDRSFQGSNGEPSVDHVYPKVKGYTRNKNKLLAHKGCNMRKGERPPHPCEVLYLEGINEIMEWNDDERWRRSADMWKLPRMERERIHAPQFGLRGVSRPRTYEHPSQWDGAVAGNAGDRLVHGPRADQEAEG